MSRALTITKRIAGALAIAAALDVMAVLIARLYIGPGYSSWAAVALGADIWLVLLAASQTAYWRRGPMDWHRRFTAGALGSLAGVVWRLWSEASRQTSTGNRPLGMVIAFCIAFVLTRPIDEAQVETTAATAAVGESRVRWPDARVLIGRLRASIPRLILLAYLAGAWWLLVQEIDSRIDLLSLWAIAYLFASPLVLLIGPWYALVENEHVYPLLLTYGVLALWFMWRRLLLALERHRGAPEERPTTPA